jgi:hypothetical protein
VLLQRLQQLQQLQHGHPMQRVVVSATTAVGPQQAVMGAGGVPLGRQPLQPRGASEGNIVLAAASSDVDGRSPKRARVE